jgi:hypothetical protein
MSNTRRAGFLTLMALLLFGLAALPGLDDCPSQPGLQEYQLDALGNGQTSQRLTVNVSPN